MTKEQDYYGEVRQGFIDFQNEVPGATCPVFPSGSETAKQIFKAARLEAARLFVPTDGLRDYLVFQNYFTDGYDHVVDKGSVESYLRATAYASTVASIAGTFSKGQRASDAAMIVNVDAAKNDIIKHHGAAALEKGFTHRANTFPSTIYHDESHLPKPSSKLPQDFKLHNTHFKVQDDAIQVAQAEILGLNGWDKVKDGDNIARYTRKVIATYGPDFHAHPENRQRIYATLQENSKSGKNPQYDYAADIFARSEAITAAQAALQTQASGKLEAFKDVNAMKTKLAQKIFDNTQPAPAEATPAQPPASVTPPLTQQPPVTAAPEKPVIAPVGPLDLGADHKVEAGQSLAAIAAASKELVAATRAAMGGNPKKHEVNFAAAEILLNFNHQQYGPGDKNYIKSINLIKQGQTISVPDANELTTLVAAWKSKQPGAAVTVAPVAAPTATPAAAPVAQASPAASSAPATERTGTANPQAAETAEAAEAARAQSARRTATPVPPTTPVSESQTNATTAPAAPAPAAPVVTATATPPNLDSTNSLAKVIKDAKKTDGPIKQLLETLKVDLGHKNIDNDVEHAAQMFLELANPMGATTVEGLKMPTAQQIAEGVRVLAAEQPGHKPESGTEKLLDVVHLRHPKQGVEVSAEEVHNPNVMAKLQAAVDSAKTR